MDKKLKKNLLKHLNFLVVVYGKALDDNKQTDKVKKKVLVELDDVKNCIELLKAE